MPRYDDRYGGTRLYVGRLASRTRSRDLEDLFSRYGRVRDVDLKHDYAFIEFSDPRDADDARYSLNGREFDGSRIIVEFAKGIPRGSGGSREYLGRGPPPGSGRCFNCGIDGHWARDCKAGDWKNKCYRCGERGHIERNCHNSPKNLSRRGRSYSRSPSPRRRSRSRSRSYSRSRSSSRSRSPAPRRDARNTDRDDRRSRSPAYGRSPRSRKSPSPSEGRNRSLSPERSRSPRQSRSPSPKKHEEVERNGSSYNESPARENSRSRSPMSPEREKSPADGRYQSPETNGRSPSPKEDGRDDDRDDDHRDSPRGSGQSQD